MAACREELAAVMEGMQATIMGILEKAELREPEAAAHGIPQEAIMEGEAEALWAAAARRYPRAQQACMGMAAIHPV
jgi:hypothetical protein